MNGYPEQNVFVFATTNAKESNYTNDLCRVIGDKSENCLTVASVDINKRNVILYRIGADLTIDGKVRDFETIAY